MTTPVYGVRIVDGKMEGDLFPIFVSIWSPRGSSEVSYVQLNITDEKIDKDDARFIASLPISHPAGVTLDQDNWASFLHLRLFHSDTMKMSFDDTKRMEKIRGCKSVSTHMSFGYYFFKIETLHHDTIGVIANRPQTTIRTKRSFPNALIITKDTPEESTKNKVVDQVHYNDEHLLVSGRYTVNLAGESGKYFINFSSRLTLEQIMKIYVEGINTISFTEELFDNHLIEYKNDHERERHDLRGRLPYDDRYRMIAHSIYGLEYIESLDKKVLIFLQKDPIRDALLAYRNLVSMMIDQVGEGIGEPEHLSKVQLTYQSLVDEYAIEVNTPEQQKEFLQKCLALLLDQV